MSPAAAFAPSANLAQLKPSATIAVSARARALKAAGRDIIDLGAGEPDFDTPEFIRRAAQKAIDSGATKYTAIEGIQPLREAIAAQANSMRSPALPHVSIDEIVVSTGSKQSLYNACVALFGPGDEVLIPTPSWTSYYEMVSLARANAVAVHAAAGTGFKVTTDDLIKHATTRTKGLMLNSPCNPTGSVYTASELRALLTLAADRGWWVITDEIYARIAYERPAARTLAVAPDRDRLVVVDGVAKAYAMTGWRIGWTISPAPLAKLMTGFQSHTTSNAATVSQYAALAALTQVDAADRAIAAMVTEFRARRDAAMAVLAADPAIRVVRPDGAFYLFVEAPGAEHDAAAGDTFAAHLLDAHNVAVVPGAAFLTPDWVRLSYAAAKPLVIEAIKRLAVAHRERREGRRGR
jgi:aspartate aminotransferase